ncbi:MAG: UMP kinase [Bacillota bacterium]|nr:UMP kinase [Eubacteriales bacterium]MDI9491312.1 UMP kinase [Bacillota bacterium]NLV70709.1 UMP kinase [Clostridiales bacterium]MDD3537331.1 UMP kinase [Eubacteriales bacterium]MDD4285757.1 UMP kinase [Eubacteriales bacterium]
MKPKYKRIILKISGEALAGESKVGLDESMLNKVANDVKALVRLDVQVAIVVGGGNFWRGRTSKSMDRATADYMGMLATVINALALQDAFEANGIPTRVQTAIEMREVAEPYIRRRALAHLDRGIVVIFAAGTGNPFFSTDTTAALRAAEMEADVIFLAKKVDAVYDSDPSENPNAKKFTELTHMDVLEKDLKVMDSTAASLCRDNKIRVHVFGLAEENGIMKACLGENIGTIIR